MSGQRVKSHAKDAKALADQACEVLYRLEEAINTNVGSIGEFPTALLRDIETFRV